MSQPPAYNPTVNFAQEEASSVAGRSTVRTGAVDTEFANLATTLSSALSNLAAIQRDDTGLQDQLVSVRVLAPDVLLLFSSTGLVPRGAWITATAYAVKDVVEQSGSTYICIAAHTSGTFATDLAAARWMTLVPAAGTAVTAHIKTGSAIPTTGPSALGTDTMAIGNASVVTGTRGIAIGRANAAGTDSLAAQITDNSTTYGAQGDNTYVIGKLNKAATGTGGAFIGGGESNSITAGNRGAILSGFQNSVAASQATVAGGQNNTIGASATGSVIIGSSGGSVAASATYSAIICGFNGVIASGVTIGAGIFCSDASQIAANNGVAIGGSNLRVRRTGQVSWGAQFVLGDGQASHVVAQGQTTNATPTSIYTRSGAGTRLLIENNTTVAFSILVCARRTDVVGEAAAYRLEGLIANNAGTTALVGAVTKTVLAESDATWDANAVADNTNDALDLQVTGAAAKTIKWAANVTLVEVGISS